MTTEWVAIARKNAVEIEGRRSDDQDIAALASCIVTLCDELAELRRKIPEAEPALYQKPQVGATGERFHDQDAAVQRMKNAAAERVEKKLALE